MVTTIEQQVAMDEALVPSTQRLRIGRSNLRLPSDIQSKESTLQLVYDVLRRCPFFKAFLVTADVPEIYMQEFWATAYNHKKSNEMYYPRFTKVIIHHFMSKDPSIPIKNKINWHYVRDDFIFLTIKVVSRHQNSQQYGAILPIELTNDEIRNIKAYKEYYAFATGEAVPPKANARRKRNGSDTSITPPTATTTPKLTAAAKGKQPAKAKSLSDPSKDADEDKDGNERDDDEQNQETAKYDEQDNAEGGGNDEEEAKSDEEDDNEETREEDNFDPIPRTPERSEDEGDGEEDQGLNVNEEEHVEEEKEDKLYRDVNINQERGLQATLEVKDTHVTLTPINSDGQQESSSVSSQFVTESNKLKSLEANFSEYRQTNPFAKDISNILVVADLSEMELKKILIEKMEGNKSIQRSDEPRNLYKALVDAYEADKPILDSYGETIILKRRRNDDDDQDERPFAGSDRGSKRWREGKESESASTPLEPTTKSADRSTVGSKSRQASASEFAFVEEPVQTTSQIEVPSHPVFETGAEDQPIVQTSLHPEWFSQPKKPPTSDHFFKFIMNRLKVDTLTPEILAGPTFELMKGSCTSLIKLEYHLEEVYKATTDQLDWVKPEGQQYPHNLLQPHLLIPDNRDYGNIKWIEDLVPRTMWIQDPIGSDKHALWGRRIIAIMDLKIVEWHIYKHLDWILVRRKLTNLTIEERFAFNVSLMMFTRSVVIQRRMEDLQLGVESYQKRLNLSKPDTYRSHLNDGTLNDVRTSFDDRLKGIRMQYLPQTIWRKCDKDRAAAMIQAIDKMLKTRRIMMSLEKFVGGRLYEEDFRMLQRTI
nr:hypothetical protein [Tanacetum cinerariifolium]